MLTQIYEVSTPGEARSISATGIDHIGVRVGDGEFPRELSMADAVAVTAAIPTGSKFSALFLTSNVTLIEAWARELGPDILHLGAAPDLLSPDDVAALKNNLPGMLVMRSVPVVGEASIDIARSYDGIADFLLLDSHRESDRQIGALGVIHDWTISRRIVELVRTPVISPGAWGLTTLPTRSAPFGLLVLIPKPKPTATDHKRRISNGFGGSTKRLAAHGEIASQPAVAKRHASGRVNQGTGLSAGANCRDASTAAARPEASSCRCGHAKTPEGRQRRHRIDHRATRS